MLFKKQLQGFAVEDPLGGSLGKLDGLILDLSTWKVKSLVVVPGALKKRVVYKLGDMSKFDEKGKKLIISREIEPEPFPEHATHEAMPLKSLFEKKVMTSDEQKLKDLYDIDIATQLKGWDVWKLMIQTPVKERRLRMSPKEIADVGEHIVLKLSMEEIETREKEAEGAE